MLVKICFMNNGGVVAKIGDSYVHMYNDMEQLAKDILDIELDGLDESNVAHWDNNELGLIHFDHYCNSDFVCYTEGDLSKYNGLEELLDLDKSWGTNVEKFLDSVHNVLLKVY